MAIFPKLSLWRRSLCPNLGGIDPEKLYRATLSTAKKRRLNQFGTAVLVWCGKSVKFDRVCRTFVELNLGSTHGMPSESDVAPVSLQSRTQERFS